jgi:hypothetical protein
MQSPFASWHFVFELLKTSKLVFRRQGVFDPWFLAKITGDASVRYLLERSVSKENNLLREVPGVVRTEFSL